jgi:hypothetical protein
MQQHTQVPTRTRIWLWLLLFSILISLSACVAHRTSTPSPAGGREARGDLVVVVWASQVCASYGDTVTVRGTVTNVGSQEHTIELKGQVVFDLRITDESGEHRWSEGKPLTSDLTRLELKPQESKILEMQWKVPYGGSGIIVTAQLIDDPNDLRGPVRATTRVYAPYCPGGY